MPTQTDDPPEYTKENAKQDLLKAMHLWKKHKSTEAIQYAVHAAEFLKDISPLKAGHAFLLLGNIFFLNKDFEKAENYFLKSFQSYEKAKAFNKLFDSIYNAAIASFYNNKPNRCLTLLEEAQRHIKDPFKSARVLLYLGKVFFELNIIEKAKEHFEKGLIIASSLDSRLYVQISESYASAIFEQFLEAKKPLKDLKTLVELLSVHSAASRNSELIAKVHLAMGILNLMQAHEQLENIEKYETEPSIQSLIINSRAIRQIVENCIFKLQKFDDLTFYININHELQMDEIHSYLDDVSKVIVDGKNGIR